MKGVNNEMEKPEEIKNQNFYKNTVTFEDIKTANELISTTNIKGKEYAEVNQRIKAFRSIHPNGQILSEIVSLDGGVCLIKAIIKDADGWTLGDSFAYEKEGSSFINKSSYIENCHTSAVGRALGMCGFGIDMSVASAEEVGNAIKNQNTSTQPNSTEWRDRVVAGLEKFNVDIKEFSKQMNLNTSSTEDQFKKAYMETIANWEVETDAKRQGK